MISTKEALDEGMVTATRCADWFHGTNASHLQAVGIDREDLIQHLFHQVLVRKFLPFLEKQPNYYEISTKGKKEVEAYKASVYESCRRSCFALHRGQIRSQKRGLGLLNGLVFLDHVDVNADGVLHNSLVVRGEIGSSQLHKLIAEYLPTLTMKRVWSMLVYGNAEALRKFIPEQSQRESLIQRIRAVASHVMNPHHDTSMTEDRKSKLRALVAAAKVKGLARTTTEETEDSLFQEVVEKLKKAGRGSLMSVLKSLDNEEQIMARDRPTRVIEHSKAMLDTDYEILSDTFGVEVNSEMSTLAVVGVLSGRVEGMSKDRREEIPDYIWNIYNTMRDLVKDAIPRATIEADEKDAPRVPISVQKLGASFEVLPGGYRAEEFLRLAKSSNRFTVWVRSLGINYRLSGGKIVLEGERLQHASREFVLTVLRSFDLRKDNPIATVVSQPRQPAQPRKPAGMTSLQELCLQALVDASAPRPLIAIARAANKPAAAANSAMEALRRAGRVACQRGQVDGKSCVIWSLS